MAYTLDTLASTLKSAEYAPMTEEEILRQAQAQYGAAYENQVLGAQQAYGAGELAYDRQLAQLAGAYRQQAEQAREQAKRSVSETDRSALAKGMQRSSYNLATLASLRLAGDRAVGAIGEKQVQAQSDIAAERALKAQQLAQTLEAARREYDLNVMAYADKLREREYQRRVDTARYQNELAMAIFAYENQLAQQQSEYDRWLTEFNESVRRYEASVTRTGGGSGAKAPAKAASAYVGSVSAAAPIGSIASAAAAMPKAPQTAASAKKKATSGKGQPVPW